MFFLEHDLLGECFFAQNGIVYHLSGYLIVARSDNQKLYRISLKQPFEISQIRLEQELPRNPDGLELLPDQRIEGQAVLKIRKPTTMVAVESALYALESGFNVNPPPSVYRIEKVNFKDASYP